MSIYISDFVRRDMRVSKRVAHDARSLRSFGKRRRHMMRVISKRVADDLGVDVRAARLCALVFLENQHRTAFAHHEPVATAIEWSRRMRGIIVPRRHRADDRER